jgi:CheY-like chemotaxis protein
MGKAITNIEGEPLVILLVEDNPDHKELILRNLKDHRLANTIHNVSDGEAALDYLYHKGAYQDPIRFPAPHLILLDLRLPKIDGLEVLKQIKKDDALKSIPVVVLTTSEAEADIAAAYANFVNSYLVKPVDFDKFKELMDDLGFYWLAWNRCPNMMGET